MNAIEEPREVIDRLSTSVWAFATLASAVETGLLDLLAEPRRAQDLTAAAGLDAPLVERVLDVLVSLGLVRSEGDSFVAAPGMLPLLRPPARDDFVANLRSAYLQSWEMIRSAKQGHLGAGWSHTDPDLLQAQGRSGRGAAQMLAQQVFPRLPGLEARLQGPGGTFLDVGTGVGVIAIEFCRMYPNLRAVGIEPQAAPLAEARRNVAAAGLDGRIELRAQRVEDLADREAFDLVFLPNVFMPLEAFRQGLPNVFRALRPGGWVSLTAISAPGPGLEDALARLRNVLWGGTVLSPEQVVDMARAAGFDNVQVGGAPGSLIKGIMARRPA